MVEELEKSDPSNTVLKIYWLPILKAAIELNGGNSARLWYFWKLQLRTNWASHPDATRNTLPSLSARPGLLAGTQRQRRRRVPKLLDHRGIVQNFPAGALAHLQLGRAYALSGDTAKAKLAYRDFLALWKDADADVPILNEARQSTRGCTKRAPV
jgi:eukaryotic-like serine/threonine-protein kinase